MFLNPCIEIFNVNEHSPVGPDGWHLATRNHVLNGFLATADIEGCLVHRQKTRTERCTAGRRRAVAQAISHLVGKYVEYLVEIDAGDHRVQLLLVILTGSLEILGPVA